MTRKNVPEDILLSNFKLLSNRVKLTEEQKRICIDMLVDREMSLNISDIEGAYGRVCKAIENPTPSECAAVCRRICTTEAAATSITRKNLFGTVEQSLTGTHGKIAYVRNKRSDDAFLAFSKVVGNTKADYLPSFTDACVAVYDNGAEFCILPIENNIDGKLYSFYLLLDRYELKICHTLDVVNEDGSETITFALAGRNVSVVPKKEKKLRFEFSVIEERSGFIGQIIRAAEMLGGSMRSICSLPVEYDDRSRRCCFAFDLDGTSSEVLALYLYLEFPGYVPLGLYRI